MANKREPAAQMEFDLTTQLFKVIVFSALGWFSLKNIPFDPAKVHLSYGEAAAAQADKAEISGMFPRRTKAPTAKLSPAEQKKDEARRAYLERYAAVAQAEMRKYGIPASITLAQGLLESDAGQSKLARATLNHFGQKCFSRRCGKGHCVNFTDDTHKDFFIKFKSVWESYRAHSNLLKNGAHYRRCFRCGADFACWADALQDAGYATVPDYAQRLKRLNAVYDLATYDEGH